MPQQPFQAFTVRSDGLLRRIITNVSIFPPFKGAGVPPNTPGFQTTALWDTGASQSFISPLVAQQLALAPIGKTIVNDAGGQREQMTHLVNIMLPNFVGLQGVRVTEFTAQPNDFQVIVGMDIINYGDFSLTHVGGKTCMSFRIPSLKENDYIQEHYRNMFGRAGRNDPCPCGTMGGNGKVAKFKDCHQNDYNKAMSRGK